MTTVFHRICRGYRLLGGVLVLAMIGILLAGIVLREVFGSPLVWANEISLAIFLWIVFVGAGVAFAENIRIRFTLATATLPSWLRPLVERAVTLIGIGLLVTFFVVAVKMVWVFRGQRFASVDLPVVLEWMALPVGLALAILAMVRTFIWPDHVANEWRDRGDGL